MFSEESEKIFYKRLTQLRMQKGISARDMSLSLGQNENYINLIENKHNFPSMTGFFYICEFLNITPAEFFNSENNNPYKTSELLSLIQQLDENLLEHIIAITNALVSKQKTENHS